MWPKKRITDEKNDSENKKWGDAGVNTGIDLCTEAIRGITEKRIEDICYPYLAGIAGNLSFENGWSEGKQKFLEKTNEELAKAIKQFLIRKTGE